MAAIPVISGLLMVAVVLLLPYAQLGGVAARAVVQILVKCSKHS
jgi:hypothetical protein